MSGKQAIRVSEEVLKEIIHPYAKLRGWDIDTAVDRLLHIGWSRHKALQSYGDAVAAIKTPKVAKKKAAKKAAPEKKPGKKASKKKRASAPPLAAAAGEANAPAPVADQELPVAEQQFDDDFNPVPPPAVAETPTLVPPPVVDGFDPFETYDADAPDDEQPPG